MGFSKIFTSSLRVVETGEKEREREREGPRAKKGRDIGWVA